MEKMTRLIIPVLVALLVSGPAWGAEQLKSKEADPPVLNAALEALECDVRRRTRCSTGLCPCPYVVEYYCLTRR